MKKLILCDIDGTMVINESISKKNKETVQKLQAKGHLITLATGRHYTRAIDVLEELNIDLPMISSNGAVIYDSKNDKLLQSYFIDYVSLNECISLCKESNIEYILYTEANMRASKKSIEELHKLYKETDIEIMSLSEEKELLLSKKIVKVLVVEYDEIKLNNIYNKLKQIEELDCNISDPGLLNIGSKIATKGNGLRYLLDYFDIDKENTIALGNADNDISMIEEAKIGVSVGNDSILLKQKADISIEENLEIAFYKAIEEIGVFE